MKALALISGGLDSTLAVYLVKKQGIEVEGVNFRTLFCTCTPHSFQCSASKKASEFMKIPFQAHFIGEEILEVIKNPRHGYGQGMNPCLDCRILMFKKARKIMEESGASFLVTGEVLGQRPMSQRKDTMRIIEKEAGVEGLVLRPLSAKLLPPTLPEEKGWVKREELLGIQGRSRKPQMSLAEEIGLEGYPSPAGGCLLTDPSFARRMKDLLEHKPNFGLREVNLLKLGRHIRLSERVKVIVGRDEKENREIEKLHQKGETLLECADFKGALLLLEEDADEEDLRKAASLAVYYSKGRGEKSVRVRWRKGDKEGVEEAIPSQVGEWIK